MALEIKFIQKKEGDHIMARYKLLERIEVVQDGKSGELRMAKPSDKDGRFLLGGVGQEIEMAQAEALGLVKPAKKEEKE